MLVTRKTLIAGWECLRRGVVCCTQDGRILLNNFDGMTMRAQRGIKAVVTGVTHILRHEDRPEGFFSSVASCSFHKNKTSTSIRLYDEKILPNGNKLRRPVKSVETYSISTVLGG